MGSLPSNQPAHRVRYRPALAQTTEIRALGTTICGMATLTIRTDPEVEQALEYLTGEGYSRSQAARMAIVEAERAHRRARLRAEADALRNDPEDVAPQDVLGLD